MSISFGNFKKNEISELIPNKDPLGLNSDIESYKAITAKSEASSKIPSDTESDTDSETKIEYDAIPHYFKLVPNFNNNTDSNTENTQNTSPTLQLNKKIINRPIQSVSSGNLDRSNTSFKSFKYIEQSCNRSCTNCHTDNMDKILDTSSESLQNNLTIQSKSNELIDEFNIKTRGITKAMQDLHLNTIDLRNKLSRGQITNKCPIITQVTVGTNATTQVRKEIYPPAHPAGEKLEAI